MFKDTVKKLREERGLTMAQLAEKIGVTKSRVNMWENKGTVPRQNVLLQLAQFFDVSTDILLGNRIKALKSACKGEVEIPSVGKFSAKKGASEENVTVKYSPKEFDLSNVRFERIMPKTNAAECEHDLLDSLEMQMQKVEAELDVLRDMVHTARAAYSGKDKNKEVTKT
ncbi:MAG: helix-turn-helix domain-containing protein [Treponema sp.]|nr:helix-turn-helix domain-containing protein [Treponema sp.]